ncbi:hypothetical protein RFI_14075, partial [Reticulomyxa filosa]
MSLIEAQDASTFEVINAKGHDKITKGGNVLVRNMNTRRAFGSELTNLAPSQIVNVDVQDMDNQMKNPAEKPLKRNSSAAELDEQGPPLKRCRYNLNRSESDVESTKNEEKDEKANEMAKKEEEKEVIEERGAEVEGTSQANTNGEEIKTSIEATTAGTRDRGTVLVNHDLKSLQLSSPCRHHSRDAPGRSKQEAEGLSPDIVRQRISTYFNEVKNLAEWDVNDAHDDLACVHYVNDIKRRLELENNIYIYNLFKQRQQQKIISNEQLLQRAIKRVASKTVFLSPTIFLFVFLRLLTQQKMGTQ